MRHRWRPSATGRAGGASCRLMPTCAARDARTGYYGRAAAEAARVDLGSAAVFFRRRRRGRRRVIAAWPSGPVATARSRAMRAGSPPPADRCRRRCSPRILGRPERFINMLRVFKPQSAMSVGSWTLTAFSSPSGASAFAAAMSRRRLQMPCRLVQRRCGGGCGAARHGDVDLHRRAHRRDRDSGVESRMSRLSRCTLPRRAWRRRCRARAPRPRRSSAAASSASPRPPSRPQPASSSRCEEAKRCRRCVTGCSGALTRAGGVLSGPVPLICRALAERHGRFRRVAGLLRWPDR